MNIKATCGSSLCLYLLALSILLPGFAKAQQPVPVVLAEARLQRLYDRVEVLGTLRANETVEITASVTDTITAIHFNDGDSVSAGDILVEMTSSEEHALLEVERSTVDEARKQFERIAPLVDRGAASKALYDERQRDLATAQGRLRAIESRLQDRLIPAPFSGVVGLRNISVGALVEPGDLITTLDDVSVMKLDFTVPAVYLTTLKQGVPIKARSAAFGERVFAGEVSSIDTRVDPVTRSIVARALLNNGDGLLKPGLMMTVELLKNSRDGVVVPEEALIPAGTANRVLVVDRSGLPVKAERREIRIGMRSFGEVEVVEGLQQGEYVITHGTMRVRSGQEVEVLAVDDGGSDLHDLLTGNTGGMR